MARGGGAGQIFLPITFSLLKLLQMQDRISLANIHGRKTCSTRFLNIVNPVFSRKTRKKWHTLTDAIMKTTMLKKRANSKKTTNILVFSIGLDIIRLIRLTTNLKKITAVLTLNMFAIVNSELQSSLEVNYILI